MRFFLGLVALLLCNCAHRVECTAHGGPVWRELRTQHFLVLTDLPQEQARSEALDLEELRLAIRWYFQLPVDGDDLTEVLFLRSAEELREFVDLDGFANTAEPPEAGFLVSTWAPPKAWRRSRTIPHELAHRFSADAFPRWGPWLEEGVASYLETIRLNGPYIAKLGGMGDRFGFEGRPLTLEQLWALPWFTALEGDARQLAYSSAWAYVHYLTNHEPEKWARFQALRRTGRELRGAFEEVFPQPLHAELEQRVRKYKANARFRSTQVDMSYERRILGETELPPWRIHLLRGLLEQSRPGTEAERLARVAAETAAALALAPAARPWLLKAALAAGDPGALLAAAAEHPEEYLAQLTLAGEALRDKRYPAAAASARAALGLRPSGPTALRILGLSQLYQGEPEAAAPNLERAHRVAPWSLQVGLARAELLSAQGKCAELAEAIARLRGLSADPDPFWDGYQQRASAHCASRAPSPAADPPAQ